jgi:hypothetical protein
VEDHEGDDHDMDDAVDDHVVDNDIMDGDVNDICDDMDDHDAVDDDALRTKRPPRASLGGHLRLGFRMAGLPILVALL